MAWIRGLPLGKGSYGTVFEAYHEEFGNVVVKTADIQIDFSLQREHKILSELRDCQEIVHCHGYDVTKEFGTRVYNLFLERARKGSLFNLVREYVKRYRTIYDRWLIPESHIKRYTTMILKGLSCIHRKGYVHCDLKPENILVFPMEGDLPHLKLSDFGLSKDPEKGESRVTLHFRGTPCYMSPESILGDIEPPLDIWSLGCVVLYMFTGNVPWHFVKDMDDLMLRIAREHELPEIPQALSEKAKDFISKCLIQDPKERWTADMLLHHPFLQQHPLTPALFPTPKPFIRFHNWLDYSVKFDRYLQLAL